MLQNTFLLKKQDVARSWHTINASGMVLGRLATQAAHLLRGKAKRNFTPHIDAGDFVVITNAAQVRLTGNKLTQKFHFRHSGYPGGVTRIPYAQYMTENPEKAVREAVKGMLPKNRTRKKMLTRLKIYRTADHDHQAQIHTGSKQESAPQETVSEKEKQEQK